MKRAIPLTTAEKLALVAEWRSSGLSANAFAATRDIGPNSLRRWARGEKLAQVGRPRGYRAAEPATAADAARLERKRQAWLRYYAANREAQRERNRENYAKKKRATAQPTASDRLKQLRAERTARQQRAMGISP